MKKDGIVIKKVVRLLNTMSHTMRTPRDFGIGFMLYPSEIHTVEAVGACEGINANSLAKVLGITNGAVTQVTDKLVRKGLVEKYKTGNNKKEVYFKLTELGKAADQGHDDHHEQTYNNIEDYISKLRPNQIKAIEGFLDILIDNWTPE